MTVEVDKPVTQHPVMHVQQRSSPPPPIRTEKPEIVYAPPIVVRQEQPSRTYRGDWTEVDELRRQMSREELHSTADQIYHSMSKVSIGKPLSKSFSIGFWRILILASPQEWHTATTLNRVNTPSRRNQ